MKTGLSILFMFFMIFHAGLAAYAADRSAGEAPLDSARSFFEEMQTRNYPAVWADLTAKSKKAIINDVMKETRKSGGGYSRPQMRNDFRTGGPVAVAYWKAFLDNFNPEKVLKKSTWKMGKLGADEAEVIIRYRRAEDSAVLRMHKEEGKWKTGLTETFWTRKYF
jgi:hypothetical protein